LLLLYWLSRATVTMRATKRCFVRFIVNQYFSLARAIFPFLAQDLHEFSESGCQPHGSYPLKTWLTSRYWTINKWLPLRGPYLCYSAFGRRKRVGLRSKLVTRLAQLVSGRIDKSKSLSKRDNNYTEVELTDRFSGSCRMWLRIGRRDGNIVWECGAQMRMAWRFKRS
jgi:hypothetical protein